MDVQGQELESKKKSIVWIVDHLAGEAVGVVPAAAAGILHDRRKNRENIFKRRL
jgi:hypothetical protein